MAVEAFMTDPDQLVSLNGQQYVVLRPARDVGRFYATEQRAIKARLPREVPSPHTGHVTLRGFAEPERLADVETVVLEWAKLQEPISLEVEGIDGFPPPFSVLVARLARTPGLVGAYALLTNLLDNTDLARVGELSLDQWVFHMSLAYCGGLNAAEWDESLALARRRVPSRPTETISGAELVWYEDSVEHIKLIPFG